AEFALEQLYRYRWEISDWRDAIDAAENVHTPDKYDLIEIFHDIVDDYAVFSAMQQRTSKVINSKIMFLNPDGSENEDIKPFFCNVDGTQKAWFRKWLKIAQDSKYYGFEVAELGAFINGEFRDISLFKSVNKIPEENLLPTKRVIKKNANAGLTLDNSILMDIGKFANWLTPIGDENDLGLLSKATPYVIYKNIFANWRQHAEIFGQPFREGRTDIFDNERVAQMQKMFEEMVSSTYGIFHPDDEIKFIETTKTDAYKIYDQLITRCDHAITKIFLSQTGTTDEKAYVGSAETHERVLDQIVISDRLDLSEYFSNVLIPKLKNLGFIDSALEVSLTWITEENLSLNSWAEIIAKLAPIYEIPPEEITRIFNIEAEEKEVETPAFGGAPDKVGDIMKKTQNFYKKLWRGEKID
ncbi:unnamed protein product, partial [marine sediment metagenome]